MADIFNEDWEGGVGSWSSTGTPAVDAGGAIFGGLGAHITASGASEYHQKAFPASCRMNVGRVYFRVITAVSVNILIDIGTQCKLILLNTGALQAQIGSGTARTSGVLAPGVHYVDWRWTTSANPQTFDWRIDGGTNETQATAAVAAADQTFFREGMVGAVTGEIIFDQLRMTDVSGDYPLGPVHQYDPIGTMGIFGA